MRTSVDQDTCFEAKSGHIGGIPLYCSFHGYRPNSVHQHFGTYNLLCDCDVLHVHVQGEGWFGEDGLLLCQPNPLKKIHTRPMLLQYEGAEHVEPRKVCGVWCVWVDV